MLSAQLFQDAASRAMCIDMVTCWMSLVGLGIVAPVGDCSFPALLDEADLD